MAELTKKKYCDNCQKEVEAKIVERRSSYNFKGENFEIDERVLMCSTNDCHEELYDEILDSATMATLVKMYEERIGLSLEEIKSIRTQYSLSMDLFARILGWSKSTIVRYETGKYIPDASHLAILKQLKDHPESIDEYYKQNRHRFNDKEQEKINKLLSSSDQLNVEKSLNDALNINYKLYEKTIETGYNSFNLTKLVNMILYFTQKGVQKTKLMKLLFYSDFLHYKRNLLSITGTPYVRLPYGPVPKDYDLLLSTIEKNAMIDIDYQFVNDYTIININSIKEFDGTSFSEEELEILKVVENQFEGFGSVAISDFSHEEDGWKNTNDRDIISYDHAETLRIE